MSLNSVNNLRTRRCGFNQNDMFGTSHYSIASYYTDSHQKSDMKAVYNDDVFLCDRQNEFTNSFGDKVLLNNLHLIPDPLKKNLADMIITEEKVKEKPPKMSVQKDFSEPEKPQGEVKNSYYSPQSSLSSITSFFSGVLNVLSSVMFKKPKSTVNYYECYDSGVCHEGSPEDWQGAKTNDKNVRASEHFGPNVVSTSNLTTNTMNVDSKSVVTHCENKVNQVRLLLTSKSTPSPPKYRSKRPKKVFVEPSSVEESFEDAFTPEDFVKLENDMFIEYKSPGQYHNCELLETESPVMKTEVLPITESTDIVKTLLDTEISNSPVFQQKETHPKSIVEEIYNSTKPAEAVKSNKQMDMVQFEDTKSLIVSSCEDKLSKLKALLQERRKENTKLVTTSDCIPESSSEMYERPKPTKSVPMKHVKDKRFKNPNRLSVDKRKKSKLNKCIQEDLLIANEISPDELSSVENSPSKYLICKTENTSDQGEYFNEISGKFCPSSVDSEDSFQIVFTDSPRLRKVSDCDSEDSYIVFEDSPDSCYTSNDVFGTSDDEADSDTSDVEMDSDTDLSDSGCSNLNIKMPSSLSRTVSDLTDDALYEDKCQDEVDCALRTLTVDESEMCDAQSVEKTGLLLDDKKKSLRRGLPAKKVHFSPHPPKVHVMRVWTFAAKQARAGHWEQYAVDRERFKRRIADVDMAVSWVLKPQHRSRVMFQRFMPWWNAMKRKELADKKQLQEEERLKREADILEEEKPAEVGESTS